MLLVKSRSGGFLENLHFNPADITSFPFVEDGTQEFAPVISRHRMFAHATVGFRLRLDQGNKAHIRRTDLFKKTVHLKRMLDIMLIYETQDVVFYPVLLQESIPSHGPLKGLLTTLINSVSIMQMLRAIEAYSYGKVLSGQESAPFVVEEGSIRLDAVGETVLGGTVLFLYCNNFFEVVQPQNRRLTSVPGKADDRFGRSIKMLDDVSLENIVGHPKRRPLRVTFSRFQVITIDAIQVTHRAGRLYKYLKIAGSFTHHRTVLPIKVVSARRHT